MVNNVNKKVLILCNHKIVLYNFKKELIHGLKEKGYDVYISLPFEDRLDYFSKELGCHCIETKVNRRGINPFTDLKLIYFYYQLMKKIKPDLVFSLTIKPTIYGGLCAKHFKTKFITNITGTGSAFQKENLLKKIIVYLYRAALKQCDACFFENEDNKQVFLKNKIVTNQQSIVVSGSGVNLNEFPYLTHDSNDELVFSFIGRVMKEKGIDEFLYCVEKLNNVKNIKFDVYGFCEDEYETILHDLEKYENFKYNGFTNNMKKVYMETDCVVLPSYHEGMSNVLLEAAASGCIIITTDIPGCRETVINKRTGYLTEPQNKAQVLEKMKAILEMDRKDITEMRRNARNLMEQIFDRDVVNNAYLSVVEKLIGVNNYDK